MRQVDAIGDSFLGLVRYVCSIEHMRRQVITCGSGKSGIIARKIAGTLSSIGVPSSFMHPADALHGDLGRIQVGDTFLFLSNSGETPEVLSVARWANTNMNTIACFTCRKDSTLARLSTYAIEILVDSEAGTLGLAPTSSAIAMLAVGDALAMTMAAVMDLSPASYLRVHPAGALGERLRLKVQDAMRPLGNFLLLSEDMPIGQAATQIGEQGNLGIAVTADADGKLAGVLTDGDIRRLVAFMAANGPTEKILGAPVRRFHNRNPRTTKPETSAAEALRDMEHHSITALAVIDSDMRPVGLLHMHDILGRASFII